MGGRLYYWVKFCIWDWCKANITQDPTSPCSKWNKNKNWGSMTARERRDRMSCGMWCFWFVGQSEVMVCSYLPGFSGASVTFSWTSLGITKIKPNQPVNVSCSVHKNISLDHHEKSTPLNTASNFNPCSPVQKNVFLSLQGLVIMNNS